ncbi:MAG: GNAT family N-acetyltransferase [Bacilli bacterium]
MINLVKKENLNLSILETDFLVFKDIVNTFSSEALKKECLIDLDNMVVPEYFRNKITLVLQINEVLIGYLSFSFNNSGNIVQTIINKLFITENFQNKNMDVLLLEGAIYIAGEIGSRNVLVTCDEHDKKAFSLYRNLGFYEIGMNEDGSIMSVSVATIVNNCKLNEKFRNIDKDAIDYKTLKLTKKISSGRSGNIYITEDGQILKMFTSTSFTYIKDREETLKVIKNIKVEEVVKPKNLVYYDGVFVGYIMDYLPKGDSLNLIQNDDYSFEEKIEKIKSIEAVMKKLHKLNVYVCDLNPNNIFIGKDGVVKFIDCDSFVIKDNVINTEVSSKYRDPVYRIVSKETDMYAFAITALQLFTGIKINDNATKTEVEKIYDKNKAKLPISFKNYYDNILKSNNRFYLSDSYEKYLEDLYNPDKLEEETANRSGKISMIILSIVSVLIALGITLYFTLGR